MGSIIYNEISGQILDSSIEVHRNLGPGLLENVYEICLCKELELKNIHVERQKSIPIVYKKDTLDFELRLDLLVENIIIVELKAVEKLLPVHFAQLLSYLRLADKKLGLLINFNVPRIKDGFHRIINGIL